MKSTARVMYFTVKSPSFMTMETLFLHIATSSMQRKSKSSTNEQRAMTCLHAIYYTLGPDGGSCQAGPPGMSGASLAARTAGPSLDSLSWSLVVLPAIACRLIRFLRSSSNNRA